MAFVENKFLGIRGYRKLGEVFTFGSWVFFDPESNPFDEVPNNLGDHLKALLGIVPFINAKNRNRITESSIAGYTAYLPASKPVG